LPKGKITLEELSKLLLVYMSVIADILDIMKMIRIIRNSECEQALKESFFTFALAILSISILQLCLSLTTKRAASNQVKELNLNKYNLKFFPVPSPQNKKSHNNNNNNNKSNERKKSKIKCDYVIELNGTKQCVSRERKFCYDLVLQILKFYYKLLNKLRLSFESEIWGIIFSLLIKDLPFSILRSYAYISLTKQCTLWNQSLFFTLKGYLTIIIQLNRCYVVYRSYDHSFSSNSGNSKINPSDENRLERINENSQNSINTISSSLKYSYSTPSTSTTSPNEKKATKIRYSNQTYLDMDFIDNGIENSNSSSPDDAQNQVVVEGIEKRLRTISSTPGKQVKVSKKFWSFKNHGSNSNKIKCSSGLDHQKSSKFSRRRNNIHRLSIISMRDNSSYSNGPLIF
jgi:hypothetical protein